MLVRINMMGRKRRGQIFTIYVWLEFEGWNSPLLECICRYQTPGMKLKNTKQTVNPLSSNANLKVFVM